jgi:hypothetical protein
MNNTATAPSLKNMTTDVEPEAIANWFGFFIQGWVKALGIRPSAPKN